MTKWNGPTSHLQIKLNKSVFNPATSGLSLALNFRIVRVRGVRQPMGSPASNARPRLGRQLAWPPPKARVRARKARAKERTKVERRAERKVARKVSMERKERRVISKARVKVKANGVRISGIITGLRGDKEKEKPEVTRHLNDTSVTDICELGGDFATMRDVHYEVKCWAAA